MLAQIKKILSVVDSRMPIERVRPLVAKTTQDNKLIEWLAQVGETTLTIPWSAELLRLYTANEISERQKGFTSNNSNKPNQWQASWVAFGDIVSNPLIFDSAASHGQIFFAFHGRGTWSPLLLADTFEQLDASLIVWCELFLVKYQKEIFTDDFVIRDEFALELREALSKVLPPPCVNVFLRAVG